ncbi:MAG: flagellar basal body-associated FliL family protein [Deltaproteobacteria bacterium]|jgi:flagellar FliL protein|nr:flagellar basal body-associated FliL family protein [Deltaproteobacteria bacterium]
MSEKKAQEPKKKEEEKSSEGTPSPPAKGGLVKIVGVAVAAMILGGAGAFILLKTVLAPPPSDAPVVATEREEASPKVEEGEPITAPTKSGSEVGHGAPAASSGHGAAGGEGAAAPVEAGPVTVELKPFTTNLNEPSGRRYLNVTVALEVDNQEAVDEVNKKMSDIQDSVLILLSSQSVEDISSIDGKERLRSQILNRINGFMTKNKVKKVKYLSFVIQ